MCAIAGTFAHGADAPSVDRDELIGMRDRMLSRGPDGAGEWFAPDQRIGLAHRRLTIIDLSEAGAQPMLIEDGSLAITFNGEIYNYRELRKRLEQRRIRFRSSSDTEVLLHLYAEKGEAMVHDLRGMYALAIWDARKRGLFLARDPFGIKPLYYANGGGTLSFASQVKALASCRDVDTTLDPAGHVGFFLWGSVPEPFTMYRGIRSLPAGHTLWADARGVGEPKWFCNVAEVLRRSSAGGGGSLHAESAAEGLHDALANSVSHHLIADVPVGVFLSAGLDSTTIAALATESAGSVQSVTLGFDEYRGTGDDEVPLAELAAQSLGAKHQTIWVSQSDFSAEADRLFEAMDQPSIDGVNTYFVSLAARRAGLKVALSGIGGDELFGGYSSFREIPRLVNRLRRLPGAATLGPLVRVVTAPLLKRFTSPKYAGLLEYGSTFGGAYLLRRGLFMPWELPDVLDPDLVRAGWNCLQPLLALETTAQDLTSPHAKISALELSWYMRNQLLRDADWASMAHSLEVRVPLVDVELLARLAPALVGARPPSKRDMAGAARGRVPAEVLNRPKTGFNIPVRKWLLDGSAENGAAGQTVANRGLRGWARQVYARYHGNGARAAAASSPRQLKVRRSPKTEDPQRILVYRIGQLGDTIVSLPAMWAVRKAFPGAHLALLFDQHPNRTYVQSVDLLTGAKIFDEFVPYSYESTAAGKAGAAAKLIARLRAQRFDTLVYLAPSTRSLKSVERDKIFFRAAGIRTFIGMEGFTEREVRRADIPLTATPKESQLLLDRIGPQLPSAPSHASFELNLGARESDFLDRWIAQQMADDGRSWLAVGPGSKMPAKRWPLERFREVVAELIAEFDVWPVIFGGPEDQAAGDELLGSWQRGYNAAGALDLRTAALGLQRCIAYIGNDTGTMHLGAAVGVPCVAIFSSREPPGTWYPHGDEHAVFRSEIECEGCCLVECIVRQNECLRRITADQVTAAAARLLRERSPVTVG